MDVPQHHPSEPEETAAVRQARERLAQLRAALAPTVTQTAEPTLTWSNSQQTLFDSCPRARYYASELAPQGWRKDATAAARTAMRLKTLTGLDLTIGNALHDRASECAQAIRDGEPLPPLRVLRQRASTFVRYVWTSSVQRRDAWWKYPREVPMLMEVHYGRGPTPEQGAKARERMERGLVALHDVGLWDEVAACDPATILTPSKLTKYVLPDPLGIEPVLVWAVPDLIVRLPDGGPWVVVDFKSGRVKDGPSYARARRQVEGYAVYLRHGLGVLAPDEGCQGRLVVLSDGTEDEWAITAADIDAAEDRIRRGALAMAAARARADGAEQAALADATTSDGTSCSPTARIELVQLARRGAYPMTRNRTMCRFCPYLELCAPEQAQEVNAGMVESASESAAEASLQEVAR